MGQENSHEQIDSDTPTETLSSRSLEAVAEYIKNGTPKKIVVMTGAGISTSAGIPDFRSPDTGLYANLARLDLPFAEAVFDISYFRQNPDPFYVLAKELYPGKFFPTVAHSFVALLEERSMLQMLFTQNIDTLERRAGVPDEKIVEAHGSFATQRCIDCKTEFPSDLMLEAVENGKAPHCTVPQCNGLVKPDIVFFGEALPEAFFKNREVPATADLLIVMGTSLSVHPFASLPQFAREGVPRVLINKEIVGDFGSRPDDVVILGDCDEGVRKLADALGWRDDLEGLWLEVGGKVKEQEAARLREQRKAMSKDEVLQAEIDQLTRDVDASLQISKDHNQRVNDLLDGPSDKRATPQLGGGDLKLESSIDSYPTSTRLAPASDVPSTMNEGISEPPPTPNDNLSSNASATPAEGNVKDPATSREQSTPDPTLPQNKPTASDRVAPVPKI